MIKTSGTGQAGFTLVEMVVAVAVLAISIGFAIPAYQDMSANSAIRSTAMNLIATLNEARATSLSRRVCVKISGTNNGWQMTYPDTATSGCPASSLTAVTNNWQRSSTQTAMDVKDSGGTAVSDIVFKPNGFINTANTPVSFTVCDSRTGETGAKVSLTITGKVESVNVTCS